MPHQRPMQQAPNVAQAPVPQRKVVAPQQIGTVISEMQEDIKALNSSILVISQKMHYVSRNEKILGRNTIILSKRLKEIETAGIGGAGVSESGLNELRSQIDELLVKVSDYGQKILELQASVDEIKERFAKQEELKELKYVIDSIHPLEFTTIKQVQEMIDKKLKEKKR